MHDIDLTKLKDEPYVWVLAPDGTTVWGGNNLTHFDEIRAQIKEKKLAGYKVKTSEGNVYDIADNGRVGSLHFHPNEGEMPGDVWMSTVERLL